jgi:hypothetical protein
MNDWWSDVAGGCTQLLPLKTVSLQFFFFAVGALAL